MIDRSWLRERFDAPDRTDDELFDYLWECLEGLRAFYARLEDRQEAMVFTVDG